MQDFGAAYLAHYDALLDLRLRERTLHASQSLRILPAPDHTDRVQEKARLERAFDGDWASYDAALREDGRQYAAGGATVAEWHSLALSWSHGLLPLLLDRFAADAGALRRVLVARDAFFLHVLDVVGASFEAVTHELERRREIELQAVFASLPDGVLTTDDDGFVTRANERAHVVLHERVLVGRPLQEVCSIAPGDLVTDSEIIADDGSLHAVRTSRALIAGSTSEVILIQDVSADRAHAALQVRSAELENENVRVHEATRLKSEFLANMSHELRTPLNAIVGFSELLVHGEVGALTAQQHDFVTDIYGSGSHLLRLINDILDLSKVEAGVLELQPSDLSLEQVCGEVAIVLQASASEAGVTLAFAVDPAANRAHLDGTRLKQVLYNYLSNAIKFSVRGGGVTTTIVPEGTRSFRIEVADSGCGIDAVDLPRLFRTFEQLDAGRAKHHGGTGLGLALTRRLVEAQGGTVGVRSSKGEGSVFFAVLPLCLELTKRSGAASR